MNLFADANFILFIMLRYFLHVLNMMIIITAYNSCFYNREFPIFQKVCKQVFWQGMCTSSAESTKYVPTIRKNDTSST